MHFNWRYFVFVFFSLTIVKAQEVEVNFEELLYEQLAEELGENVDVSEVIERLNYYRSHPLNLNIVTEADLANLVFLSPFQIENILHHRQMSGDFINVLELQGIRGFSPAIISLLQNFVTVGENNVFKNISFRKILSADEQMLMVRYGRNLEPQSGYFIRDEARSRYLGDANRYAVRYRWNYENRIRIAVNMEKDAGEPFFKYKQKYGFDFYSGSIEFNNVNKYVKKIVLGDYSLQFGQGLVVWNGLSFGKGAWIGAVARQAVGLKAYSSLNENNFQRGIATKLEFGNIEITPFVAMNSLSGNVTKTDSTDNIITTISFSGLHRTPNELSYRNQVQQLVYGTNLGYRYKRLKVSVNYMATHFNGDVKKENALRNLYAFEGKYMQQLSLSYQTSYRNYHLFGETAYSFNHAFSSINGLIASLHPKMSLFMTYRNYGLSYHTFYGQAIGEGASIANERGVYTGVLFHPSRKIEWVNYVDVFRFPWLRYRVDAPSYGSDFLSQLTYSWYKKGKVALRFRYRLKQENLSLSTYSTNILADIHRSQLRLDFHYKLNSIWTVRTRAELSLFEKESNTKSNGFLVYQDVFWKGLDKLQLNLRASYFNTSDYDSRIYTFESDVLYAASFPVYFDKGFRSYLNLRWRITKKLDLWSRYSVVHYFNRETIGSGLDEIKGKMKSDIKLQIRYQW